MKETGVPSCEAISFLNDPAIANEHINNFQPREKETDQSCVSDQTWTKKDSAFIKAHRPWWTTADVEIDSVLMALFWRRR